MSPKLDRWVIYGNCIVGYIYDSTSHPRGQRVKTEAIRFVDVSNSQVETFDGKYVLTEPGTYQEHQVPGFGVKTVAELPKINPDIFLSPKG